MKSTKVNNMPIMIKMISDTPTKVLKVSGKPSFSSICVAIMAIVITVKVNAKT